MKIQKFLLVFVTVLMYNSSEFIVDTLESIKEQICQNIELIISVDYATNKTLEICQKWIDENIDRFVATHFLALGVNTGIPANKNRALAKCKR